MADLPLHAFFTKMIGFGSTSVGVPTGLDAEKFMKAHELLKSSSVSGVLKLKSGEVITYAEIGDKEGIPVVWIPGPCYSRLVIALYYDICTEMGIRLVCFDRPGRGGSSALKYPKDWSFGSYAGIEFLI